MSLKEKRQELLRKLPFVSWSRWFGDLQHGGAFGFITNDNLQLDFIVIFWGPLLGQLFVTNSSRGREIANRLEAKNYEEDKQFPLDDDFGLYEPPQSVLSLLQQHHQWHLDQENQEFVEAYSESKLGEDTQAALDVLSLRQERPLD